MSDPLNYLDADFIAHNTEGRVWIIYRRAPDGIGTHLSCATLRDDEALDTFCAGASAQHKSLYNLTAGRFECGTLEQLTRSKECKA
jgi:hypothetical protein